MDKIWLLMDDVLAREYVSAVVLSVFLVQETGRHLCVYSVLVVSFPSSHSSLQLKLPVPLEGYFFPAM